ncbi:MAG: hypothetical protein ACOYMA_21385 [Bacteroidia bacterium]
MIKNWTNDFIIFFLSINQNKHNVIFCEICGNASTSSATNEKSVFSVKSVAKKVATLLKIFFSKTDSYSYCTDIVSTNFHRLQYLLDWFL